MFEAKLSKAGRRTIATRSQGNARPDAGRLIEVGVRVSVQIGSVLI